MDWTELGSKPGGLGDVDVQTMYEVEIMTQS